MITSIRPNHSSATTIYKYCIVFINLLINYLIKFPIYCVLVCILGNVIHFSDTINETPIFLRIVYKD